MLLLFLDYLGSPAFLIIAYFAIIIVSVLILVALFGPGVGYKVSAGIDLSNDSDEFLHILEALVDAKVNRQTDLTVFRNGEQFYEEELARISAAKHNINLEAYIFHEGEIAGRFIDQLAKQASSGLKVNLLLDAVGNARTRKSFFAKLERAGGRVSWYNGSRWNKLPRLNNRTHRELLVIDGRLGFIGGAGVADQWWKGVKGKPVWRDTMVRVEGDAIANLQATFAENWLESCGEVLTAPEYFPKSQIKGEGAVLVVNSTPSGGGETRARILFQILLASARKSIQITTPYFLPDHSITKDLIRAVRRGVKVQILVPGRKSDLWLTRNSSRVAYGKLLKAGIRIYEYQPSMIHVKVLLIDGIWGVVGSTNFDNRSFGLNDEVNLAAHEEGFCQRLARDFDRDLARSECITFERWRHRSVFSRAPELLGWIFQREQ
jgi:cardiolipin synthase A/B